jgi:hypothetical protein
MPLTQLINRAGQWGLILGYGLLVLTLQPLLLEHTFAVGISHDHSAQDVCAWLDHAASTAVQSAMLSPVLASVEEAMPLSASSVRRSVALFCDSVRASPSYRSSSAI